MTNILINQLSKSTLIISNNVSNIIVPLVQHITQKQILTNNLVKPSIQDIFKGNAVLLHLLLSIISITFFWLARFLILHLVSKYRDDPNILYRWRKTSSYITLGLNIIIISQIWIKEFSNLLTYLGLLSAGIAIALKDFVVNILGWMFIISAKPLSIGDRVQIGDTSGDVIDIQAFFFSLMEIGNWVDADQSTGRIIHIPNGQIFTTSLANYTKAFQYIWNEIPINITFDSDWKKAKIILNKILQEIMGDISKNEEKKIKAAAKHFMIYFSTLTPTIYTNTDINGITLTLRYLCEAKQRRNSAHILWEAILEGFEKEKNINFAYNSLTVYQNSKAATTFSKK